MLSVSGSAATTSSLLKHDGYTASIRLPAAGTVTISWATRKHVTIGRGRQSLSAAGTGRLKIKLTPAGKKLLKKSKTLKFTSHGSATLVGASPVTAAKSLTVKR